ncbi:aminotransferase-like domain-containing protein [Paenibacillus gansuensis]|uniref:PLP-dependent aminotransferase family protein n=1 Tax=Paenibacillus gansuensis TaxID=306542 RepID=A0ABW5PD14_9BACL
MDVMLPMDAYREKFRYAYLALYEALKDAMLQGRLAYGTKLPSSRELSARYGLSRGSVNRAYDMLISEGYAAAERGSGTYVLYRVRQEDATGQEPGEPPKLSAWANRVTGWDRNQLMRPAPGIRTAGGAARKNANGSAAEGKPGAVQGAAQGKAGRKRGGDSGLAGEVRERADSSVSTAAEVAGERVSFHLGEPDLSMFPAQEWSRLVSREVRRSSRTGRRGSDGAQGHLPLREGIAQYLRRARGIDAEAADIVVYSGSSQALAMLALLLLDPGEPAVLENPGYPGTLRAVEAAGAVPLFARVDGQGLAPEDWPARVLFTGAARQYPTGAVLPLERRQALLAWAERRGAVIVEDDYDSEFRWAGRPLTPLKGMDRAGRVIYVGTFTKTMLPEVRIGYALLPRSLVRAAVQAKALFEPHPSAAVEQRALAAFMNSGGYERHLRRMTRHYGRKAQLLSGLLRSRLNGAFDWVKSDAGLHMFGWWKGETSLYNTYRNACVQAGAEWTDASSYDFLEARPAACLGFAHLTESEMERGVERLAGIWKQMNS